MEPNLVGVLAPLVVIAALDLWVYMDARARQGDRREVSVTIGSLEIDSLHSWLAGCVVLFVVFFPLYLVARREAG